MRLRPTLLLSACLLFGAHLAGAAPVPPATTPASAPAVVPQAPASAQEAAACPGQGFQQEALPFVIPNPSVKAGVSCGSCSNSPCQGAAINSSCYYLTRSGYALGKCHADFTCTDPGFSAGCTCRNGPDI
jgi:hypothetical protein